MKTSLSHLPQKKQYEIAQITDIIREVLNPEMIILFGSYAKGTYVEHKYQGGDRIIYEYISDYDFLVVMKEPIERGHLAESTIMDRVDRYDPPVSLEIHSVDYINEGLERGQYFFTDIVKEGILLYDTGQVSFAVARILTPDEKRQIARDYFEIWMPQSKSFANVAAFCISQKDLHLAAFNLHQSTESLYYATLLVFTDYKPKTHNLWKLRKKTKGYSKDLFLVFNAENDRAEKNLFDLLKRAYIDARYKPKSYNITNDEITVLVKRNKAMIEIAEQICLDQIDKIK